MFVDTLAEDLTFDRAIDTYIREMAVPEPLASTVATRTLVVLGQDLVPYRRRAVDETDEERPKSDSAKHLRGESERSSEPERSALHAQRATLKAPVPHRQSEQHRRDRR